MDDSTILKDLISDTVWINEVVVRSVSLDPILAASCAQLTYLTGVEEFPVALPGSCTLLKYKGRYFSICTRHQLNQIDSTDFGMVALPVGAIDGGGTNFITCAGAVWTDKSLHDTEYHEICVFDFTEQCLLHPDLGRRFFDIRGQHPNFHIDWVLSTVAYGFPTNHVNYDFEAGNIGVSRMRVPYRFGPPDTDDAVHVLSIEGQTTIDPDGMSGGPTYFVLSTGGNEKVHLAGIAVTGGPSRLRIIKAGAVLKVLDRAMHR